ncbi:MAG: hypothetical protein OXI50_06390 [Gammaproteobacteria bacterium]|nr:hypothetical protein [Gammaproteobacteria bacterium]MYC99457.1 hypothetical protein [Gammaproteobacteria bacterium]
MEMPEVRVPLVWNAGEAETQHATHFVLQQEDDLYYLTVGQVAPPIFIGTPEEQREQAKGLNWVSVRMLARFVLSRAKARELRDLFETAVR